MEFGVYSLEISDCITLKYVKKLKNHIEWAHKKAHEVSQKEKCRVKVNYDKKIRCSKLDVRDICPVRKTGFQSKHKIVVRWDIDFYKVVSQCDDNLPVFLVWNLSTGKERVLHQNMLYPIQYELGSEKFNTSDVPVSTGDVQNKDDEILNDSDSVDSDEINLPIYQGPQTCSCTKLLMKANIVMNDHFGVNSDFMPQIARPGWLNIIITSGIALQNSCIFIEI